jgi:hypothetical protein
MKTLEKMSDGTIKPVPHSETLRLSGKKGTVQSAVRTPYCVFRVDHVRATDSQGGKSTVMGMVFVGNRLQMLMESPKKTKDRFDRISAGVFSCDFSMEFLGIDHFDVCHELITISANVQFQKDCDWELELRGMALKNPDDTRDMLRDRAVDNYQNAVLKDAKDWSDEHRAKFDAMISAMRRAE